MRQGYQVYEPQMLKPLLGILKQSAPGHDRSGSPWMNRKTGVSKLSIKEMGSRYLFIVLYIFLEKLLSRNDYIRKHEKFLRQPNSKLT